MQVSEFYVKFTDSFDFSLAAVSFNQPLVERHLAVVEKNLVLLNQCTL